MFSPGRAPHIVVKGGQKAIAFYKKPFGAMEHGGCIFKIPDGKIGHAELMIGDSPIMLADEETEHLARFQFANAVFALARKKLKNEPHRKSRASQIAHVNLDGGWDGFRGLMATSPAGFVRPYLRDKLSDPRVEFPPLSMMATVIVCVPAE